ncbi:MAG: hypothetical protein ABI459_01610, partial [Deltaproteobacteria bacterium]
GVFDGLEIGATKRQILDILASRSDITSISPDGDESPIVTGKNVSKIAYLEDYGCISVRADPFFLNMIFFGGKIARLAGSGGDFREAINVNEGDSRNDVLNRIGLLLGKNEQLIAQPCVTGLGANFDDFHVDVSNGNLADLERDWLLSQSNWTFNRRDGYFRYKLYFSGNVLVMLEFWYSSVELP